MTDTIRSFDTGIAKLEELCSRVCNWGRWGADDQIGTLNYISPQKIVEACALVQRGQVFGLGVPFEKDGPQATAPRRYNPIHFMDELPHDNVLPGEVGVADDVLLLPLQSSTQWDSLAHVSYKGRLYGDRDAALVNSHGAQVNSIMGIASKIMSRGVLVDMTRFHGVESLAPGQPITGEDLDRAVERQQTTVGCGDVILVRTGWIAKCRPNAWAGFHGDAPGLGLGAVQWLHDNEIAAVATDTPSLEVKPFEIAGVGVPVHVATLVHMGLLLGEIFDLDALAADCASDGRFDFLFVAPPLPVTGGVGSPANPYAVK